MENSQNSQINIYIHSPKPFYYPGEQILASIYLDVLENINSNKMTIITKGKQIVKAKKYFIPIDKEEEENEYEDSEEDEIESNEVSKNLNKNKITKKEENLTKEPFSNKEINETKIIFKYKTTMQLSNNNNLSKGKYIYPFEIDIPENIPGSFLYLDNSLYIEIIYSIKIKLNNINIKEKIPLIIRQKEKIFNYLKENEYTKSLGGCCWEKGETTIKINCVDKYFLGGNNIKLNIVVNNEKSGMKGAPINVEIYQKIILFPKDKSKKIKRTKLVGNYKGKKQINQRENYNEDISFLLNENKYITDNISKTKAIKYFKNNNNILPLLTQSIKSELVICEYEIYAESQFIGFSIDELGVFLKIIIFPPEKGILLKNFEDINKEFSNALLNKKIFLNSDTIYEQNLLDNNEKSKNNDDKENKKRNKKREKSKKNKLKNIGIKDDDKENQNINETYSFNNDDINENFNINNYKNNLNYYSKSENKLDKDEFFNITKKNKLNNNKSNNIKKSLNKNYLNDELDNEFLENSINN